jgi:hypothetical protein
MGIGVLLMFVRASEFGLASLLGALSYTLGTICICFAVTESAPFSVLFGAPFGVVLAAASWWGIRYGRSTSNFSQKR